MVNKPHHSKGVAFLLVKIVDDSKVIKGNKGFKQSPAEDEAKILLFA